MSDRLYVLVSTSDQSVLAKCRNLETKGVSLRFSDAERGTYLYSRAERAFPQYLSVINDQGDFSIENEARSLLGQGAEPPESDSLVSFAHIADGRFVARTDAWGIQQHYFYHDGRSFICSNNCFLVAKLVGARLSEAAVFECLFFLSPIKDRSWFEDVRVLQPGQAILFDVNTRSLTLTPPRDLYQEIAGAPGGDLVDEAAAYFDRAARVLRGRQVLVSLSSGVDSRTVLAGLIKSGLDSEAVSFGGADFVETKAIKSLAASRGVKSTIYGFESLLSDWEDGFRTATLVTNGLLNPLRMHFPKFYGGLRGDALFEGLLGSEFVKAEIAVGAVVSAAYAEAVSAGGGVRRAIDSRFDCLSAEFRSRMEHRITENHGPALVPVDTPEGVREFARFAFHFIPSRVFGAQHVLASTMLSMYEPFLSRKFLRALSVSFGVTHYNSLSRDFPGPIRSLKPEAMIVRAFDRPLYTSRLDRLFSMKEALELPAFLVRNLQRARKQPLRLTTRGMRPGQVDGASLHNAAGQFLRANSRPEVLDFRKDQAETANLLKERCTLICIEQLMAMDLGALVQRMMDFGSAAKR
ncbi:MAG: hypothetical protein WAW06_02200 [bacterium]